MVPQYNSVCFFVVEVLDLMLNQIDVFRCLARIVRHHLCLNACGMTELPVGRVPRAIIVEAARRPQTSTGMFITSCQGGQVAAPRL